jgi:hypothetical protein
MHRGELERNWEKMKAGRPLNGMRISCTQCRARDAVQAE